MKRTLLLFTALIMSGMTALLSCGNNGGTYVTAPNGGGNVTTTGTYSTSQDTLYITTGSLYDTSRYCMGDSLEIGIDTLQSQQKMVFQYSISSNVMTWTVSEASGGPFAVALDITLTRMGMGTDVQGTWNLTSENYSIVSGIAPDNVRREIDSMNAVNNQKIASGEIAVQFTFSANQVTITEPSTSGSSGWADDYISSWTNCNYSSGPDTCSYAVTVVKLNSSMVQLHGKTSGETVIITWNAKGDLTYTSSDPTHLVGTYYGNPVSCPNSPPAWFSTFLTANAKTGLVLPKKSAQQMVPKKPPLPKWLKVF